LWDGSNFFLRGGMFMRARWCLQLVLLLVVVASLVFGQAGNGTITGTVTDPAGAVISGAAVEAKNTETGVVYPAATTSTGNYTITQLPVGTYEVSVKVPGFKTYTHTNLGLQAAVIVKEDVALQVGAATEAITVTAEASLLKTESSDLATNVTLQQLDNLPLIGIGTTNSGSSGIRNPYGLMQLIPGVDYVANSTMIVNGLGSNTGAFRIEGQDFTNHLVSFAVQENQPSPDAIQEVAVQTSNYAAEFGTAGNAILNITMKSGTNIYHGTGYEYFVNEDLNAGDPFSISGGPGSTVGGSLGKYRPRNRRNDFGGTMGGPLVIPKIYNGHNKTFWFWNYEEYLESTQYGFNLTLPTPDYLGGNFSKISPNGNCSLCSQYGIQQTALGIPAPTTDALGRQLFANTIYDPLTRGVNAANNLGFANPFPGNVIPSARFDPVAVKMEALFPAAQNSNLTSNASGNIGGVRATTIPSVKIDHSLTANDKLSFYWQKTSTESQIASPNGNADGLPTEIGAYRGTFIYQSIWRLNYDRTITPTTLLHVGGGWARLNFGDHAPFLNFDPAQFGLSGFLIHRQFPSVSGMCVAGAFGSGQACSGYGGVQNIGTSGQIQTLNIQEKPSFNANITKARRNHTIKAGAEVYFQGTVYTNYAGVTLSTSIGPTSQPFTPTVSLNNFTTGFGYASFLLGDYGSTTLGGNATNQTPQLNYRQGKAQYALFLQDSWKVNRKLTLDYGVRWDLATTPKETYGRLGEFNPIAPNANAGGHPGATQYASTCNCDFYPHAYPYGIGPRVGAAYQIDSKTVFRAGWGVVYQFAADSPGSATVSTPGANAPVGINAFVNTQSPGFLLQPTWPVTDPNVCPAVGTFSCAPNWVDRNNTRPPRINQWSVGFQREVTRNLVFEASYVANRAIWLGGGPGTALAQISPATYAQYGLYPYPGTGPAGTNNYADFQLLGQAISSNAVKQRLAAAGVPNGGLLLPYSGYPTSSSLKSTLYPFPQFPPSNGFFGVTPFSPSGIANGESRYDALQVKGTKRLSHGLQVSGTFTWSRAFSLSSRQDFFNPNSSVWDLQTTDQPFLFNMNAVYTVPKAAFLDKVKFANAIIKDWQLGAFTQYGSGFPLTPPGSPTSNYLGSEDIRVAGQPLYNKSLNSHSINPFYDQVLNPQAWQIVPTNSVGPATGTLYTDFRGVRRPQENFNIGRNFRIKERMNLQFRGDFVNILNRTIFPNPSTSNPQLPVTHNSLGYNTGGFGVMNTYNTPNAFSIMGRTGTLIARFTF
jgi:hypothetical protein